MISILTFTILKEIKLDLELSPNNYIFRDTIVINFRKGGSILLDKNGRILKRNKNWIIVFNNALYEFTGGTDGNCLSVAKLSYDNKKVGFIVGCEREGYEVKLNDGKISLGGDFVDFGILNNRAFVFIDGSIYVYNLKSNKEEKRIKDVSELGMGKFLCNNAYCVFSDLTNKVIVFDSLGNELRRFYDKNWVYTSILNLNDRYLIFSHYNFKDGGFINLLDLRNFQNIFKKGMSYIEGDNTTCLLRDFILLLDGESIQKIDYSGITRKKLKLNTHWIVCSEDYIVTGGLDKDMRVFIIKP